MSEHMSIRGDIDFHHSPYGEEGSFSYCHHCKSCLKKLELELHQGIVNDWILARCPKCRKAIWTAELTTDIEDYPKSNGKRYIIKEKKKCIVCGKITNTFDCDNYSLDRKGRVRCVCSEKCERKRNLEDKK